MGLDEFLLQLFTTSYQLLVLRRVSRGVRFIIFKTNSMERVSGTVSQAEERTLGEAPQPVF